MFSGTFTKVPCRACAQQIRTILFGVSMRLWFNVGLIFTVCAACAIVDLPNTLPILKVWIRYFSIFHSCMLFFTERLIRRAMNHVSQVL